MIPLVYLLGAALTGLGLHRANKHGNELKKQEDFARQVRQTLAANIDAADAAANTYDTVGRYVGPALPETWTEDIKSRILSGDPGALDMAATMLNRKPPKPPEETGQPSLMEQRPGINMPMGSTHLPTNIQTNDQGSPDPFGLGQAAQAVEDARTAPPDVYTRDDLYKTRQQYIYTPEERAALMNKPRMAYMRHVDPEGYAKFLADNPIGVITSTANAIRDREKELKDTSKVDAQQHFDNLKDVAIANTPYMQAARSASDFERTLAHNTRVQDERERSNRADEALRHTGNVLESVRLGQVQFREVSDVLENSLKTASTEYEAAKENIADPYMMNYLRDLAMATDSTNEVRAAGWGKVKEFFGDDLESMLTGFAALEGVSFGRAAGDIRVSQDDRRAYAEYVLGKYVGTADAGRRLANIYNLRYLEKYLITTVYGSELSAIEDTINTALRKRAAIRVGLTPEDTPELQRQAELELIEAYEAKHKVLKQYKEGGVLVGKIADILYTPLNSGEEFTAINPEQFEAIVKRNGGDLTAILEDVEYIRSMGKDQYR